jgi:hypothetical protein
LGVSKVKGGGGFLRMVSVSEVVDVLVSAELLQAKIIVARVMNVKNFFMAFVLSEVIAHKCINNSWQD